MNGNLSIFKILSFIILLMPFVNVMTDDEVIEEIIVTASFNDAALSESGAPLHVVKRESITNGPLMSIGALIEDLVGISSSDFGSAVGQPIIRGMSGSRVKILSNGMVVRDVSGLGVDHINDIDLNQVQQIEVVRGPSALLYSNGAIGGIINIVDDTIAKKDFSETKINVGLEGQSVNDGNAYNLSFQDNLGGINVSAAYQESNFGNFDIPDGAVMHTEEEHDDHDEEEEHHEENPDYLSNSDWESKSSKIGLSKAGDWGYVGVSRGRVENVYGVPFHGDGHEGHAGHGDEHDDHEDEHEDEHAGDSHEGERIFSATESRTFNLEGSQNLEAGWLNKIDYHFRDSDYAHTEQHAEEEGHEEEGHDDHHEEGPTTFATVAKEYGVVFDLGSDQLDQKFVVNFVKQNESIIGDEAFMNPSDNRELTLGYYLSKEFDLFQADFGIRHDRINRKGSISVKEDHDDHDDHEDEHDDHEDEHEDEHEEDHEDEHVETTNYDRDIDTTSFALSIRRDFSDALDATLSLASVERAPSAVELFMNGPHLVTGRLEVGNVNLESEESNNIDLTINFNKAGFFGTFTYFRNDVDNYIYLQDETEEEHDEHEDDHDDHGGLILANFLQKDAELSGYEIEIGKVFELSGGDLSVSFARDSVDAEFTDGNNIPRMVPDRNIYSISYSNDDLVLGLMLKDVQEQDKIGINETVTDGFQMLNLNVSKSFNLTDNNQLNVSIFAKNLLDEVSRNHSSFVKNEVPLPGRNFGLKFNLSL